MRAAERVLIASVGILLVGAVALCWYNANSPQSFSNTGSEVPWPLVWAQIASSAASIFALVGLASAAGLLFLRAVRWAGASPGDEDPTPEPSP
ncbi:hypothetical protein F1C58_00895 [Glaciihabitans sp. INWT7]|uniref:hypothetical protein n=1 Tax=Glaciihabitans sp. INWT7 TaxID=2596912 RepID=UPI001628DD91|nr:hypothetical protein [Glaciihabitans sp. INWT7]QNE45621.1 hypothetical protein F1C58_00895 [Glaciihabitans sp. INWT7]